MSKQVCSIIPEQCYISINTATRILKSISMLMLNGWRFL